MRYGLVILCLLLNACVSDPDADRRWCSQMLANSIAEQGPVQDQNARGKAQASGGLAGQNACEAMGP